MEAMDEKLAILSSRHQELGGRIRGTLGDIDPLNTAPFKRAISKVKKGPFQGVSLMLPRKNIVAPALPQKVLELFHLLYAGSQVVIRQTRVVGRVGYVPWKLALGGSAGTRHGRGTRERSFLEH